MRNTLVDHSPYQTVVHGNSIVPTDDEKLDILFLRSLRTPLLNFRQYEPMERVQAGDIPVNVNHEVVSDKDRSMPRWIGSLLLMIYQMLDIRITKMKL